jgi:hypothetical protein
MDRSKSNESYSEVDLEGKKNTEDDRKKSFYRRVSVHHFHVMKDQMVCCCCVPIGMAFHIIACLDLIFGIFLVVETFEYFEQS